MSQPRSRHQREAGLPSNLTSDHLSLVLTGEVLTHTPCLNELKKGSRLTV